MVNYIATMLERIVQSIAPEEILNGKTDCRKISLTRLQKIYFAAEDMRAEASIEKQLEYMAEWTVSELQENGVSESRKVRWSMKFLFMTWYSFL